MSKIIIGGHKVTAQADYSTTEIKTGEYWIDGKPIYRKTFDCGYAPNNTIKTIDTGLTDVALFTSITGTTIRSDKTCYPLPYVITAAASQIGVFINFSTTYKINLSTGIDRSDVYCYVTLEYTKTTD